jgi:hypothetical protein
LDRLFNDLPVVFMSDFPFSREDVKKILKNLVAKSGC